jgi:hypothetical protein
VKPTVGRIVHFYNFNDEPLAAIVSRVRETSDEGCDLVVFENGVAFEPCVRFADPEKLDQNIGTCFWTWPPRV